MQLILSNTNSIIKFDEWTDIPTITANSEGTYTFTGLYKKVFKTADVSNSHTNISSTIDYIVLPNSSDPDRFIVEIKLLITKNLSDNICYYQINNQLSEINPSIIYPANQNINQDSICFTYIGSNTHTNESGVRLVIEAFDSSRTRITMTNLDYNCKLKMYSIM